MSINFKRFIKNINPIFEFNWHHNVQCELIDNWLNNNIKHLMILAPPRSSKTELVSRMLPIYLDTILSENKKVLHLTYSNSQSDMLRREYYRKCGYRLGDASDSIVKFHGVGCSLSSKFDYIIMDDPIKSMSDANSSIYMDKLWNWYISEVLTRLDFNGKLLMISSHYLNDIQSKIITTNDPNWTIAKFPLISEKDDNLFRERNEVLWNRILPLNRTPRELEKTIGKFAFTTLYQQEDPKSTILTY